MGRTSTTPNVKTLEAKSLFLVGDSNGERITDMKELAARTGCHENTLRAYQREWQHERNEMLKSVHDGSLVLNLSEETLENHKHDETFIRKRMDSLKMEFNDVQEVEDKLFNLLDKLDTLMGLNPKSYESLIKLLEKHLEANASKRAITSQFLTLQKVWHSISGLDTRLKAGEAALKAIAVTQAKAETMDALEKRKSDRLRDANPGNDEEGGIGLGAFDQD